MTLLSPRDTLTGPLELRPVETHGNEWIALMRPAAELAAQIAGTEFVPAEFRNRPEAVAACILFGAELGVGPMVALAKVAVIKGKPAPTAELGRALAFAAGHELWVEDQTNTRVVLKGKRRGQSHIFTVGWSLDDARKAGIAGNPAYAKYPRQMLLARASAELVRQMCPEVLGGITMFAEEAVDAVDFDTVATATTTLAEPPVSPPATRKRSRAAKMVAKAEKPTRPPVEPADPNHPSEAQTRLAMASFTELAITERDERLNATTAILGRPVLSWTEVTRDEASQVINTLEAIKAGGASFAIDDQGTWTVTTHDDELLDQPTLDGEA